MDAAQAAVRELARPLVLEAMIDFERETHLRLNSTPFELECQGRSLTVVAQDVEGMLNIYRPWPEDLMALVPEDVKSVLKHLQAQGSESHGTLRRRLVRARDSENKTADYLEGWVSDKGRELNCAMFLGQPIRRPKLPTRQPSLIFIKVQQYHTSSKLHKTPLFTSF